MLKCLSSTYTGDSVDVFIHMKDKHNKNIEKINTYYKWFIKLEIQILVNVKCNLTM